MQLGSFGATKVKMADAKDAALELLALKDDDVDALLGGWADSPLQPTPGDCASAFSAPLGIEKLPVTSSSDKDREHDDDSTSTTTNALVSNVRPVSDVMHSSKKTKAMNSRVTGRPREPKCRKRSVNQNPKPKPTSQRQKEELAILRAQTSELQQELSTLQTRTQRNKSTRPSNGSNAHHSLSQQPSGAELRATISKSESLWETMASRQQKDRLRAELENAQLKVSVSGQLRFAKLLQQAVRKSQVSRVSCGLAKDLS